MCNNYGCQQCYPSVPTAWRTTFIPTCSPCGSNPSYCPPPSCPSPSYVVTPTGILLIANFVLDMTKLYAAPLQTYTAIAAPPAGFMIQPLQIRTRMVATVNPIIPVPYNVTLQLTQGLNTLVSDATVLNAVADETRFYDINSMTFTNPLDALSLEVGTNALPVAGNGTLYIQFLYTITNI